MKILIACAFSQIIAEQLILLNHDVITCDWKYDGEKGLPHYKGDVLDILYEPWDMILAFPDCTYLTNSGVRWLHERPERWELMKKAAEFFNLFLNHPCKKKCTENPIQHKYARQLIKKYDQLIQPFQFGDTMSKATCLWLEGLPRLIPTKVTAEYVYKDHSKQKQRTQDIWLEPPGPNKQKNRSRMSQGIANAMAEQWGNDFPINKPLFK